MASKVENRMAFAFPVLSIDKLAIVISTLADSSFRLILRLAIITSRLIIRPILNNKIYFVFKVNTPFEYDSEYINEIGKEKVFKMKKVDRTINRQFLFKTRQVQCADCINGKKQDT